MSEPISPELVLIDPELAAAARAALPDPGTFRLPSPISVRPIRSTSVSNLSHPPTAEQQRRRSRRSALTPVALIAAVIVCVSPFTVWQSRDGSNSPSTLRVSVASAQRARPLGTTFTWPRIQNAQSYRLDVRHTTKIVFTIRTKATRAELPINPHLPQGTYSWRVAPILNLSTLSNIGAPIVEGVFTIGQ